MGATVSRDDRQFPRVVHKKYQSVVEYLSALLPNDLPAVFNNPPEYFLPTLFLTPKARLSYLYDEAA